MKKIVSCFLIILLLLLSFTGCDYQLRYMDNNPELQVIARHSLLGVFGGQSDQVLVLETDNYGRNLFAYNSWRVITTEKGPIIAVLVSQKSTDTDSYFYDGKNAIYCERTDEQYYMTGETVYQYFTEEQIEKLKQDNDWNKPINEEKLFGVKITRQHQDNVSTKIQREAFSTVSDDFHKSFSMSLAIDKNGKSLYLMQGYRHDDATKKYYYTKSYLVMFDDDKKLIDKTGIMELTDLDNYTEQLNEFKKLNGWAFS